MVENKIIKMYITLVDGFMPNYKYDFIEKPINKKCAKTEYMVLGGSIQEYLRRVIATCKTSYRKKTSNKKTHEVYRVPYIWRS